MTADMGRILVHIATIAVLLAAGAFLLGGAHVGVAAVAGGAVAVANWVALRWLADRMMHGSRTQRVVVSVLMALKLAVLGVVCWALVVRLGLNPFGLLVGLSAFVLGTLLGSVQGSAAVKEEG